MLFVDLPETKQDPQWEQEGKPYNVAKMAGVNKFLRIYYARAMELYR